MSKRTQIMMTLGAGFKEAARMELGALLLDGMVGKDAPVGVRLGVAAASERLVESVGAPYNSGPSILSGAMVHAATLELAKAGKDIITKAKKDKVYSDIVDNVTVGMAEQGKSNLVLNSSAAKLNEAANTSKKQECHHFEGATKDPLPANTTKVNAEAVAAAVMANNKVINFPTINGKEVSLENLLTASKNTKMKCPTCGTMCKAHAFRHTEGSGSSGTQKPNVFSANGVDVKVKLNGTETSTLDHDGHCGCTNCMNKLNAALRGVAAQSSTTTKDIAGASKADEVNTAKAMVSELKNKVSAQEEHLKNMSNIESYDISHDEVTLKTLKSELAEAEKLVAEVAKPDNSEAIAALKKSLDAAKKNVASATLSRDNMLKKDGDANVAPVNDFIVTKTKEVADLEAQIATLS